MFGKDKEPEAPKVDKKAEMIAKLAKRVTDLENTADALDSEITKLRRALDSIRQHGKDESDERIRLYKKAESVDGKSKGRSKALDDKMNNEYARKEKPTPSQKKKAEEIRKKAKEQGI